MGIEPTRSAWEAEVLPLNYTCKGLPTGVFNHILSKSGRIVNIRLNILSISLLNELFQLVLDALERIVDALDVPAEHLCDLLIALAVQVCGEHPALERGKRLVDAAFDAHIALLADEQLLRIGAAPLGDHVKERAVALLLVDRLVEGDVGVERDVLLPRRRLDGGDDLPGDAQLREA